MHPLRVLLYVSLVVAVAIAWGFGAALHHAGVARGVSVVLAAFVFFAFLVPWGGVFWWAVRRAGDLDELTDRTRAVAEGELERPITDRTYHGELDDLARAIEETRDIILRQRAAHELHRAAMAEIVDSLGEGIVAVNPKGRIVVANPRVAEMFGIAGDVVGRSVVEVVRKQSVVAAIDKALHGVMTSDRVALDDSQFEMRVFPVAASPDIAVVALFVDVTTVERLNRVRRDFLDDFSHEIRTPLAGLRSAAETFEQGGLTRESEQQLRQVMQRQIARIERLVTDLSQLNQIETGQLVLDRRPVNVREILSELCEDFRTRSRLTLRGEDTIASIDPERAQQIFSNILDNACKHAGDGEITVDVHRENAEVVVRVSDEGPGIPPAEIDRIFHRFYRVDRSRSQPGTGLGLAIAKHLVALHGGTIRAYNRAAAGATFEVRLPAG
ncbi:MAG TPA: ATP-binding protein [Thermoanaerobaculia bacterium]|nr:ATP-binding protein [Thermoanaerobaculia bacterium]